MYRDVQEPVLNAMGAPNPFQALSNNQAVPSETSTAETNAPVPNPWAANSQGWCNIVCVSAARVQRFHQCNGLIQQDSLALYKRERIAS